jgi:translation initiation factor IF-3
LEVLTRDNTQRGTKVRLVGEGRNDIVGIEEAFIKAEQEGLDLVCVSDKSEPWVVRIQDYKKIEYEKKKTKKAQKAKGRQSELKEIQLKINISDHDLQTKINNIKRFLERGDKVKLMVRLKGRERENPERAKNLIDRVASNVEGKIAQLPGPMHIAILERL